MKNKNPEEFKIQIYDKNFNIVDTIDLPNTQGKINEILDFYELDSNCNINICNYKENYLKRFLPKDVNIFTLNLLAEKLSEMNNIERNCFEGMMRIEYSITCKKIPISKMLDMADSTDKCKYIHGITNNQELAEFYDINNLYSKVLERIPDDLMDFISFERLGDAIKADQFGVYTTSGYVYPIGNIEQKYKEGFVPELELIEGAILLNVEYEKKSAKLWLSACQDDVEDVLDKIGAETLYDCNIELKDCVVSSVMHLIERELKENVNMDLINEFAFNLEELQEQGQLNKYRALVEAEECNDLKDAYSLSEHINDFYYCRKYIEPTAYAVIVLKEKLQEIDLDINSDDDNKVLLYIGEKLMTAHGVFNTEFGTIANKEQCEYIMQLEGNILNQQINKNEIEQSL